MSRQTTINCTHTRIRVRARVGYVILCRSVSTVHHGLAKNILTASVNTLYIILLLNFLFGGRGVRPNLLDVLLLEPGRSNFSISDRMITGLLWLREKVVHRMNVLFGLK